jgi:hypothetical protein
MSSYGTNGTRVAGLANPTGDLRSGTGGLFIGPVPVPLVVPVVRANAKSPDGRGRGKRKPDRASWPPAHLCLPDTVEEIERGLHAGDRPETQGDLFQTEGFRP